MYWWAILAFLVAAVFYMYSISSKIKVTKSSCSSCPAKQNDL